MRTKQYTFHQPTEVTHVYPDGTSERVRYGQFEAIEFTHENGQELQETVPASVPNWPVMEITKTNGTKVVADEGRPFYKTHEIRND